MGDQEIVTWSMKLSIPEKFINLPKSESVEASTPWFSESSLMTQQNRQHIGLQVQWESMNSLQNITLSYAMGWRTFSVEYLVLKILMKEIGNFLKWTHFRTEKFSQVKFSPREMRENRLFAKIYPCESLFLV
jgi:hypothetical protein